MIPLRFVLVRTRSPGNVGSVARAMKNFGFSDLTLVDPRLHRDRDVPGEEPFFEREAGRMAWDAGDVLASSRRFGTLVEAVAGCGLVLSTAPHASPRLPGLFPEEAAERLCASPDPPPALVLGSESSGLTSEELSQCAGVVVIPTDPAYRDLNLAQTAVLMAYLVFRRSQAPPPPQAPRRAEHAEVQAVTEGFLDLARSADFLKSGKEPVSRELRALLHRVGLTRRETELLRSLVRRLKGGLRSPRSQV